MYLWISSKEKLIDMTEINYWLMKSEPDAYSIDTLKNDGVTLWDGIRTVSYTHLTLPTTTPV